MTRCASSTPACRGAWVSRGCSRSPARRTRGSSTPRCSRPWPGLPSRRPSSRPICVCCSTKARCSSRSSDQVGSSAMAYKRNPMRAERMTGLARFVIELEGNAWHTAAEQWLERTLGDSANRRLVVPEAFLAADAILVLATNVAAGLEVREPVIARHVAAQLPFLATEPLLLRGVKAGGDRQRLHEVIRTHSLPVAQAVAEQGAPNHLLERLARDPAFRALKVAARPEEREPAAYVGRAPRQVDEFLEHVLPAVLHRVEAVAPAAAAAEVTV